MLRRASLVLFVVAALAGCGDDDAAPAASPAPEASAVATEEPAATATPTASATPTATEQPAPEEQEGGAGDEEAARVPVQFTVSADGVQPPEVGIPAFLAIELVVRNDTDAPVTARLDGVEPLSANPGETVRAEIDGRRPGRYPVRFGEAGDALLVTGVEPGP